MSALRRLLVLIVTATVAFNGCSRHQDVWYGDALTGPYSYFRSDHGLFLMVDQLPSARISSLILHLSVGSAGDAPGQHGLAHALEHVAMQGNPAAQSLQAQMARFGSDVAASTKSEFTEFSVLTATPRSMALALSFYKNILTTTNRIDESRWANERLVIQREIAARESDPVESLNADVEKSAFRESPSWSIPYGNGNDVAKFNTTILEAQRRHRYVEGRATIVVAGPLPAELIIQTAEQIFHERFKPVTYSVHRESIHSTATKSVVKTTLPAQVPHDEVIIGYVVGGAGSNDHRSAQMLAAVASANGSCFRRELGPLGSDMQIAEIQREREGLLELRLTTRDSANNLAVKATASLKRCYSNQVDAIVLEAHEHYAKYAANMVASAARWGPLVTDFLTLEQSDPRTALSSYLHESPSNFISFVQHLSPNVLINVSRAKTSIVKEPVEKSMPLNGHGQDSRVPLPQTAALSSLAKTTLDLSSSGRHEGFEAISWRRPAKSVTLRIEYGKAVGLQYGFLQAAKRKDRLVEVERFISERHVITWSDRSGYMVQCPAESLDDLLEILAAVSAPDNRFAEAPTVVTAVGGMESSEKVVQRIATLFRKNPGYSKKSIKLRPENLTAPLTMEMELHSEKDFTIFRLALQVLQQRLYTRLRLEQAVVYQIALVPHYSTNRVIVTTVIVTDPRIMAYARMRTNAAIVDSISDVSSNELEFAKDRISALDFIALDDPSLAAIALSRNSLLGIDAQFFNDESANLRRVTSAQVLSTMKKMSDSMNAEIPRLPGY